ncbi:MAG: RNA polymerase sigma factor RpoD/SigA [Paludibacteraceae bacterium]|nr:RNA polymerase sigma factor RpoD/SigA [Paludibacteraceae bacterium]
MIKEFKVTQSITERTPILNAYMQDISRYPLLSLNQEVELTYRARRGDEQAKQQLINCNLRFVISIAKQYIHQGIALEDLIMEGNLGLITAIEKFDPMRGFKLSTYAVWWIRQAILNALCEKGRSVRIPLNQVGLQQRIKKCVQNFIQVEERQPTISELAELLQLPEDKIEDSLRMVSSEVSIDLPVGEDGDSCLADLLQSNMPSTDSEINRECLQQDIQRWLLVLDERSRDIIIKSFGLSGAEPMTLDELGAKYALSRERVRQIQQRSLVLLSKHAPASLIG